MDTWFRYKQTKTKQDLRTINVAEAICYGNYLVSQIAWKVVQGKKPQKLFDKFFKHAGIVFQATQVQHGFDTPHLVAIYNYIDTTYATILNSSTSARDYALMLGNITEIDDTHYTFTELVAFVRAIAAKI